MRALTFLAGALVGGFAVLLVVKRPIDVAIYLPLDENGDPFDSTDLAPHWTGSHDLHRAVRDYGES
jgi:hypothetical protein